MHPRINWRNMATSLTDLVVGLWRKTRCDKNVTVPCSERLEVEHNGSERISGKRFKNQVERRFITRQNTLGDLQDRYTRKGIGGSNPSRSAVVFRKLRPELLVGHRKVYSGRCSLYGVPRPSPPRNLS